MAPQERHPTGICHGVPSLQHLHLWPANHRLQKVCICWRPSNHACWWRLAGSGRRADQLLAQIPRSNVGQVAHVSPTPWVTSQEADITRRAPEVACWLQLGCWSNNSANSHLSPYTFNRRVLRVCLVPQYLYPPHRRLANCDWMPASYIIGQLSNPRRYSTCWASSQCHTVSNTPCHGAWTSAPLSAHPSI